jgi:hypothetical protein
MKQCTILIAILFFLIPYGPSVQEDKLIRVNVEYTSFLTESFNSLNCDSFKVAFSNKINLKIYSDAENLNKLSSLKTRFSSTKIFNMDVRWVITFDYGQDNKVQYCFDRYGHFEKDGVIFSNKKLLHFLGKEIKFWY